MKTSSRKAKGRRCSSEVKDLLLKYAPNLKEDDIVVTSSGCTGEDLMLSPAAQLEFPLVIECKNVESINIWAAYGQAKQHLAKLHQSIRMPAVFFRRNRSDLMVCLSAEDFMKLTKVSHA